jgi:hypothetical protein
MVTVYFETKKGGNAEQVATFDNEELYDLCYPVLEKEGFENGFLMNNSVRFVKGETNIIAFMEAVSRYLEYTMIKQEEYELLENK